MGILLEIKRLAVTGCFSALLASTAVAANLQLVSLIGPAADALLTGNGDSTLPVVSADGRLVLFASTADNLIATTNGSAFLTVSPTVQNVFVRDLAAGTNGLVSVNLTGTAGVNGRSTPSAISTNNQFVLFESDATNFINDDTNNATDVFMRDLVSNTTTLVSTATNGVVGNGASWNAVATPDGRYVAFVSAASNLVSNDTNGIADVFLRDLQLGTTTLVSVGAKSTLSATLPRTSETPAISDGGRYVAFYSSATNLVPGVRTSGEVYVRDLQASTTIFASTNARSLYKSVKNSTNVVSCNLRLRADGNYVAFATVTNLATIPASALILRYSLATGLTDVIHTNASASVTGSGYPFIDNLDMTPDGRFVTFVANVTGFSGTNTAIYLWDAQTGTNQLVSANTNNVLPAPAFCDSPRVSTNGQFVAFLSTATGLVTNPLSGQFHLYLRDTIAGSTSLVDADTRGTGAGVDSFSVPLLNADGTRVFFECTASGLVANDRNRGYDVFLRDPTATTTTLISAIAPPLTSSTPNGNSFFSSQPISQDGRFIAFANDADNLVQGDTNLVGDVFVRDLFTGSNILVSLSSGGVIGNNFSSEPSISGNGRYVAFTSTATNFFAGDANKLADVFVRDLQLGTTIPVSVIPNGTGTANGDSYSPTISTDGRYILFRSLAGNLSGNPGVGTEHFFLRDEQTGTNYFLTSFSGSGFGSNPNSYAITSDGKFVAYTYSAGQFSGTLSLWDSQLAILATNYSIATGFTSIGISPDGNRIAYFTYYNFDSPVSLSVIDRAAKTTRVIITNYPANSFGLRFSADSRWMTYAAAPTATGTNQVYLYDFLKKTNILVSHDFSMLTNANGSADSPDISADGRFVVYRCAGNNLVPGDTNGVPDIFLYDATTGINTLLSASVSGNFIANDRSTAPVFSGDGQTLLFRSQASNLAAKDLNHSTDVLAFQFLYALIAQTNGLNPTISWPALPDQLFHVDYKDSLTDPLWQTVAAPVIVTGNRGQLTDPSPGSASRFYRVVREN